MKLKAREPELPSLPLKLDVPGKLHEALEDYSCYYQASHGHEIAVDVMAVDILSAFVATDYGFKKWRRERAGEDSAEAFEGCAWKLSRFRRC